jgi:hypothetical protein
VSPALCCSTARRRLLSRSTEADFAIHRVRLAAIDFTERDLARLATCRVVLGRLDVNALIDAAEATSRVASAAANLAVLRRFIAGGRVQIRAAGTHRWSPDFCIIRGDGLRTMSPDRRLSIVGHLGVGAPAEHSAGLTCVVAGTDAATRTARAFDRLWREAHDVLDVVAETLDRFGEP